MITGHLEPDSGEVVLEGRNITGIPPHKICGMGIARSFQRTNIFSKLTVYENIQAAFIAHGGKGLDMWGVSERQFRDETAKMIEQLSLQDIAYTMAGEVSHGAQKQVELGIALAGEPRMLLLDEPTAGMSAQETHESIALLARIAKERALTLLFTEHDMEVVFSIADKIAVLHQGRIIATGVPDEVRQQRGGASRLPRGRQALTALLDVEGIHTAYGSSRVLFGVTLDINAGECVCLLGRNGVGKTTTMRSIMGLTPPSQGRIRFKGQDITGAPPYRLARRGIGYVPEDRRIFAELTVWENLEVAARSANRPGPWNATTVADLFPKLGELRDRMGGVLSGGEQQMLTIARTLMGNPELLLLDEPSEGLAPVIVENLLGAGATPEARRPDDPAGGAGCRILALARRPGVRFGERRGTPFGARGAAARRCRAAQQIARTVRRNPMPFVNIRILKGHPQERKDEIARRVTETISEVAKLPKEAVWVVFEDVTADDWYVGEKRVSELQKKAAQSGAKS